MMGVKVQRAILFCYTVCGLFLQGCGSDSREDKIERKQRVAYRAAMNELPAELKTHFPIEIPAEAQDAYFFGLRHDSIRGYSFQALLTFKEVEFVDRADSLRRSALVSYTRDEVNLMRINLRFHDPDGLPDWGSGDLTPPVPARFIGHEYSKGLGPQFELLVLNAQPYGPSDAWQSTFDGGVASDSLWQSGFSYGVLLDSARRSILYWTEQW